MEIKKGILKKPRRIISFIISLIILSGLIFNAVSINNNVYIDTVNALSPNSSSSSRIDNNSSTNTAANNNTNNFIQINKEQNQSTKPKTHEYTLIAENTTLEIAPGLRVDAWTYNGTIPGPTLTATEGDRVIVHFINKTPLPHTVHLHGDHPREQDGVFEQVMPNGTYTYDIIVT